MVTQYQLYHIAFIQKLSEIFPLNRISFFAKLVVKQYSSIHLNAQLRQMQQGFALMPHLNISSINLVNGHRQALADGCVQRNIPKKHAQSSHGYMVNQPNGGEFDRECTGLLIWRKLA